MIGTSYPIGVFDLGYGGLTILKEFVKELPDYDFMYLGDNARAPYGNRSYETVYQYTLECVQRLFEKGSRLVILACNTASAKALRTIQQNDLPLIDPSRRVLGVIRPTSEVIGTMTKTGHVGVFATTGTVTSQSYIIEIEKFFPQIKVFQQACPLWVPLIENNEINNPGADYFAKKYIDALMRQSADIDTILLGCTHYPLMTRSIQQFLPANVSVIAQGDIVAKSLKNYLQRHPEMDAWCSKNSKLIFYTTDSTDVFNRQAALFFGRTVEAEFMEMG